MNPEFRILVTFAGRKGSGVSSGSMDDILSLKLCGVHIGVYYASFSALSILYGLYCGYEFGRGPRQGKLIFIIQSEQYLVLWIYLNPTITLNSSYWSLYGKHLAHRSLHMHNDNLIREWMVGGSTIWMGGWTDSWLNEVDSSRAKITWKYLIEALGQMGEGSRKLNKIWELQPELPFSYLLNALNQIKLESSNLA